MAIAQDKLFPYSSTVWNLTKGIETFTTGFSCLTPSLLQIILSQNIGVQGEKQQLIFIFVIRRGNWKPYESGQLKAGHERVNLNFTVGTAEIWALVDLWMQMSHCLFL